METKQYLNAFYEENDEDGRLLTRMGMVEYITTMKYVDQYLKPGMKVLEIGAATGRYSHALAQRGFEVDAVELLEHNIEIFRKKTLPGEKVTIHQGNAVDLSFFANETYDVTLLLGPMYHLFTEEDKLRALSEALRVTKRGGVVFVAYCMGDASILSYGFLKGHIHDLLAKTMINPETFDTFSNPWDLFELHRREDIEALRSHFDVEPLHLAATDGYAGHIRGQLEEMDEVTYQLFVKYHLAVCERVDMLGYSNHTLDVFRKR